MEDTRGSAGGDGVSLIVGGDAFTVSVVVEEIILSPPLLLFSGGDFRFLEEFSLPLGGVRVPFSAVVVITESDDSTGLAGL